MSGRNQRRREFQREFGRQQSAAVLDAIRRPVATAQQRDASPRRAADPQKPEPKR